MSPLINTFLLPLSLFIIMLGIGLSTRHTDFLELKRLKTAVIVGVVLQILGLPLLAFTLIKLFSLTGTNAVALMIVACCAGGVTSNALTFIFSGIVALSIVLTLITSVIAPFTLPLISYWSLHHFTEQHLSYSFELLPTVFKLFTLTLVPIIIGQLIQWLSPDWCYRHTSKFRQVAGIVFIVLLLIMTVAQYPLLINIFKELGHIILTLICCSIALGYSGATWMGFNQRIRLTLSIEVGIQNAGMGLVITGTILNDPALSMVLIAYGIVMQIPMLAFAAWQYYRIKHWV